MKQDDLQHSEKLASYFAPRREEASLLSTEDVEKLLSGRAMLPNQSRITVRKIIMTLTGMAGLAAIGYLTLFNHSTDIHDQNNKPHSLTADQITRQHSTTVAAINTDTGKHRTSQPVRIDVNPKNNDRPWAAPANQVYADLSKSELAKLGIALFGDTVYTYKLNDSNKIEAVMQTQHMIGGGSVAKHVPSEVQAHRFYPVLVTMSNGNAASYRIENGNHREWVMMSEHDIENQVRDWLQKPGTPGYYVLGFGMKRKEMNVNGQIIQVDTLTVRVGKNLPQPRIFPLRRLEMEGYSDSTIDNLMQLAHYYEGSVAQRPAFELPKRLAVQVDTVTAQNMLDEMDREQNSAAMQHMRSIMTRLNELVPVIVRMHGGTGAPTNEDFIFWYEPSDELFAALPEAQSNAFRNRLQPRCLTAPNGVLDTIDIHFCVENDEAVDIYVRDLTGKQRSVLSGLQATSGENSIKLTTEYLESGMYLITVHEPNGNEQTRRVWVENAHPKGFEDAMQESYNKAFKEGKRSAVAVISEVRDTTHLDRVGIPAIPMLELSSAALGKIGIESNNMLVRFYTHKTDKPTKATSFGILRAWGAQIDDVNLSDIRVAIPQFRPIVVTDGLGRKRAWTGESYEDLTNNKNSQLDNLIPVLLRVGNPGDSIGSRDLIFWYKPTTEFLSTLSDSAREVATQMANVSDPNHRGTQSVKQMAGVIEKAVAYPNPSKGKLTLQMTMDEPRKLTFALLNLLGQERAHVSATVEAGSSSQPLDFSALDEGVYLLDITSDVGEEMVQRIVIAR